MVTRLQVDRLDFFQGLEDGLVAGGLGVELASDLAHSSDDRGAPFVDSDVNSETVGLHGHNLLNGVLSTLISVHAVDGLDDLLHDDRVAQLPDCERAPFEEAFDTERGTAID